MDNNISDKDCKFYYNKVLFWLNVNELSYLSHKTKLTFIW